MKATGAGLLAVGFAAVLAGAAAWAAPVHPVPPACADGGAREHAHGGGWTQGEAFVASAWAAAKEKCDALEVVRRAVHDALARRRLPPEASEELKCRNAGFEAGANAALDRLAGICSSYVPPGGRR